MICWKHGVGYRFSTDFARETVLDTHQLNCLYLHTRLLCDDETSKLQERWCCTLCGAESIRTSGRPAAPQASETRCNSLYKIRFKVRLVWVLQCQARLHAFIFTTTRLDFQHAPLPT
jgi:hypothetical protein